MSDSVLVVTEEETLHKKILGVRVRHARTKAGLNLKEIGKALGLPADMVSDIEMGYQDVSLPQLEAMALVCNIPVTFFWSNDVIEKPNLTFPTQEAMMIRRRIIGTLLRQARTTAGRTQEELANKLGLPVNTISDYEFGKTEIPLHQLETLSKYLNLSLNYFLDQGIAPHAADNRAPTLDDITDYTQLPREVREFLSNPANILYINIAMKLSKLSADTLRTLAEGLLEVTY